MHRSALQRWTLRLAGATSLAVVLSSQLFAQALPAPLAAGARVRVQAAGMRAVGTVQEVRGDTLVMLGADMRPITLARGDLNRVWVSEGRRSTGAGIGRGLGLGLLIGGVTGAVLGIADGDDEDGFIALTAEEKAMAGFVALGGAGALVGAIAGAALPGERWKRVDRRTLAVRPSAGGGVTFALSRSF